MSTQYDYFGKLLTLSQSTGICTEQRIASKRLWPTQITTKMSLLMEHGWAVVMFSFAHCPWLFGPGACAGQQTPTCQGQLP